MPLWWRTQVPDCRRSEPDNAAPALHDQELYTLGVLLEKGHIKPAYWQPFRKEPGPRESCRRGRRSPTKDAAQPVKNASRPLMVARSSHAGARFCRSVDGWLQLPIGQRCDAPHIIQPAGSLQRLTEDFAAGSRGPSYSGMTTSDAV